MFPVFFGLFLLTSSKIVSSHAAVIPEDKNGGILSYENTNDGQGNYKFSFETFDNIKREEYGTLINAGQPDEYILVNGFYSYIRPDGKIEMVEYVADKDGYRVLPPIPTNELSLNRIYSSAVVATLLGK